MSPISRISTCMNILGKRHCTWICFFNMKVNLDIKYAHTNVKSSDDVNFSSVFSFSVLKYDLHIVKCFCLVQPIIFYFSSFVKCHYIPWQYRMQKSASKIKSWHEQQSPIHIFKNISIINFQVPSLLSPIKVLFWKKKKYNP